MPKVSSRYRAQSAAPTAASIALCGPKPRWVLSLVVHRLPAGQAGTTSGPSSRCPASPHTPTSTFPYMSRVTVRARVSVGRAPRPVGASVFAAATLVVGDGSMTHAGLIEPKHHGPLRDPYSVELLTGQNLSREPKHAGRVYVQLLRSGRLFRPLPVHHRGDLTPARCCRAAPLRSIPTGNGGERWGSVPAGMMALMGSASSKVGS
jgi:hypothetical protein